MSDNSDKGGKGPGGDAGRVPVAREKLPTLTNAKELEAALKKSMELLPSSAPSPKMASTPSKPPPPLVLGEFTDLDKGWGDDDLEDDDPSAKPAAGSAGKKPGGRRSSKMRAAATPVTKPNDVPTAPPPMAAPPPAAAMPTPPPGAPAAPVRNVAPPLAPPPALETFDLSDDTAHELGLDPPPIPPKVPEPPPTKPGGMDLSDEEPHSGRKSFPSTRSLVSGLDEDALVSSLFDEDAPQVEAETRRTADPAPAHPAKPPRPPVAQPPRPLASPAGPAAPAAPAAPVTAPAPPAAQAAIATETSASRAATRHAAPPDKPADKPADPARDMRDRFALGDYTGALESAEAILAEGGADQEALDMAQNCRDNLEQMYKAKLGALDRVPIVMVPSGELRWLSIDHRAGFVLSNIDGVSSLEMIIDVSGMPPLDALRILCELAQQRIISFR